MEMLDNSNNNSGKNSSDDGNLSDDATMSTYNPDDRRNTLSASLDLVQQLTSDLAPPLPPSAIAALHEKDEDCKKKIASVNTTTTAVGVTYEHNQVTSTTLATPAIIEDGPTVDNWHSHSSFKSFAGDEEDGTSHCTTTRTGTTSITQDAAPSPQLSSSLAPPTDTAIQHPPGGPGPVPVHFYSVEAVAVPDEGDEERGTSNGAGEAEVACAPAALVASGDVLETQLPAARESERPVYQATLVTTWYKDPKKLGCLALLLGLVGAAVAIGVSMAPSPTTNGPAPPVPGGGVGGTIPPTLATEKPPAELTMATPVANGGTVLSTMATTKPPEEPTTKTTVTNEPTASSSSSPTNKLDWHAEHTIPSASYQDHFDEWAGKGYILRLSTGFQGDDGGVYYNTIWHKNTQSVVWIAHHDVSEGTHQDLFHEHTTVGYRLVFVDGYDVDGIPRMNSIYEYDSDSTIGWQARHGQNSQEYQTTFDNLVGIGYRPDIVSSYQSSGTPRYASIFSRHEDNDAWVANHGITSARFQTVFDDLTTAGYSLEYISVGTQDGEEPLFSSIFVKIPRKTSHIAYHDIADVQAKINQWGTLGYVPIVIDGYKVMGGNLGGSTVRYSLLLQKLAELN